MHHAGDRYSNDTPDSLRPVAPPGSRRPPAHEGGTQGRHAVQTSYSPSSNSNYLKPREASPAGFSHAQNGFKDPPAPAPPSPAVKSMVTHHAPPQPADSYVDDDSNFRNDVVGATRWLRQYMYFEQLKAACPCYLSTSNSTQPVTPRLHRHAPHRTAPNLSVCHTF